VPQRFSSRLPWSSPENQLTRLLAARRAEGKAVLDLTESNPTRVGLDYPETELRAALGAEGVARYTPDARGLATARAAIATEEGCRADDLLLTASTSEAYGLLFKLLCDPGDAVLAPRPCYPLFDHLAGAEGVRLVPYPLVRDDGWRIDMNALEATLAAEPRARAIVLVSPGNPSGAYVERDQLARLDALGVPLIVDEVFARYPASDAPAPARVSCAAAEARAALTFSLGGLSKSCGLPQLKLGWIHAGGPADVRADALARLELLADAYLSVSAPVMLAAPRLLELGAVVRAQIAARVRQNRAALASALAAHPEITLLPAAGGWSAILRYPSLATDEELALRALAHGILVHPGYYFDLDDGTYLVISLLPEPAPFADAVGTVLTYLLSGRTRK
jgi:alanine-synthesizing transaminase